MKSDIAIIVFAISPDLCTEIQFLESTRAELLQVNRYLPESKSNMLTDSYWSHRQYNSRLVTRVNAMCAYGCSGTPSKYYSIKRTCSTYTIAAADTRRGRSI